MNVERLIKLAKFLKTVPEEKFNLRSWANHEFQHKSTDCGTQACAVGWATTIFKDEGLRLMCRHPVYLQYRDWDAVEEFFDISNDLAFYLFYRGRYKTSYETSAIEVAERIEQVVCNYLKSTNLMVVNE